MKYITIAIMCLIVGFAGAYFIWSGNGTETADISSTNGQLYTCGMHPQIISNKPGRCPICNMKLTPIRNQNSKSGSVRIDPTTKQNMGLVTVPARYIELTRTVNTFGKVAVPEPNTYRVTVKTDGWVEHLFVAEEGEFVHKGQPLLEIYSPDLVAAQKELLVALKSGQTQASMERVAELAEQRLRNWDISEDQLKKLKESGEITRTMTIRSPVDGYVQKKNVNEGDRISAMTQLFQIVDISHVWIEASIYEQDLPFVQLGQSAVVTLPGLPGKSYMGRLNYISPIIDDRGQIEVRLELDNPGSELKPEMYADVVLENKTKGKKLAIPRTAVINSGLRQLVFVATSDDEYKPRTVTTGAVDDSDMIEITAGLAEGDAVVVSGQFLLDSETRLNEAVGSMSHDRSGMGKTDQKHDMAEMSETSQQHANNNPAQMSDSSQQLASNDPYDIHTCPMPQHYNVLKYGPGKCPECGMDLVPVSETKNHPIYVCPMPQCGTVQREPGKCPKCNMDLVEYQPEVTDDK